MEVDALIIRHIVLSSVGDNASSEGHATQAAATIGQAAFPMAVRGAETTALCDRLLQVGHSEEYRVTTATRIAAGYKGTEPAS